MIELEKLTLEQLKKLDEAIKQGKIAQLIEQKSQSEEPKSCAICGRLLAKNAALSLEFGSPDFRKRAFFCAFDCMDYFTGNLRQKDTTTKTNNPMQGNLQ